MPGNPRTAGIREFDRLFRQGTLLGRSEAELLDLFVCSRDEFAFEALVTRHGPMVLRTCRALLADPHDADDAFQATFLVLSRRAGSIRNAKLLGPWLHRVARRVCSRSLAESSRRSRLERPSTDALATLAAPCATLPHADRAALHEAIDLLPERYRRVIILCDLEGHSHAEAAARLRCPIGTVKGRQSRARSLLRRRLTRLGLAPASLLSGTLVSLPTRAFSVPHTLIHRTSRTAATFALGSSLAPGTVPGVALSLATGVLSGMAASQLKFTALVGLLALCLGSSGLAALRFADDGDGVPGVVSTQTQGTERDRPDDRDRSDPDRPVPRIEADRLTIHLDKPGGDRPPKVILSPHSGGVDDPVVPATPAAPEDPLQGRWVVASVFPPNPGDDGGDFRFARGMVLDIKDGRMAPLGLEWGEIEYELRPEGNPKQIDVTYRNDSMWGSRFYRPPTFDERGVEVIENVNRAGIYEFRNPEMLKLYFAEPGGLRPTTMESNVSAGQRAIILDRLPADPNPSTPPSPDLLDASKSPLLGVWRCIASEGLNGFEDVDLTMEIRADESPVVRPYYKDEMSLSVTSRVSRSQASATGPIAVRKSRAFVAPAANPVRIDFLKSSDDPEGELPPLRTRGILRLEEDTLILHLADFDSNTRPSGFERSPNSPTVSLVYRRDVPDEPPTGGAAGAEPTPDQPELLGTWERISMADEPGASPLPLTLELAEVEPWLARNLPAHGVTLAARFASTDSPSLARRGDLAWFDPASDPRRLDLYAYDSTPDGDAIRQTWSGSYSLEADRLTLKLVRPGSPIPSDLDPQSGAIVETYRRLSDRPDAMPQDDPLATVDPTDAELDALLDRWEQASSKIETLFASFELVDEMTGAGEKKVFNGTAYLNRPNSVLLQWDRQTNGEASTLVTFDRRILMNDEVFVEFDGPARQITVYPLAGDKQERALDAGTFLSQVPSIARLLNTLLPTPTPPAALQFVSCPNAENFKRRYRANLMPSAEEGTHRLAIYPRHAADRDAFSVAVLILDAQSLQPKSIHTLAPNGKDKQNFSIKDFKPDVAIDPELFAWDSSKAQQARNDGWRVIVMPAREDAEDHGPDNPSRDGPGGAAGAVPTPAADAEGNRPDDRGRAGTGQPDDSPDEPRPSPFDRPRVTGGPRELNLEELNREQLKLLDEVVRVRPEVELLTIEAEVFGELYRERLEDHERIALDLAQRPDDRDQRIALADALDRIKQQYLDRMSRAADRQTYLRSIESSLEGNQRQVEAMRYQVDDHPALSVETIERRLSTLEAKLDRLLELLESPDR